MTTRTAILLALALGASASFSQTKPTNLQTPSQPTNEQVIAQFRNDLQAQSADVMAKGLTLNAEQAAKFWPLFETFQKEQATIVDAQLKATTSYMEGYASMSDADAMKYINALLERDQKIHDLRVKWLAKFQTVVPANVAARAIHIDRRLGLVAQLKISSQVPLVK